MAPYDSRLVRLPGTMRRMIVLVLHEPQELVNIAHAVRAGPVMTHYYRWYASRTRGMPRRQPAGGGGIEGRVEAPVVH